MNRKELLSHIKDALQREGDLSETMVLKDIEEWDSLSTLSIIGLYDRLFSRMLQYKDINTLETISDLINLVADKLD